LLSPVISGWALPCLVTVTVLVFGDELRWCTLLSPVISGWALPYLVTVTVLVFGDELSWCTLSGGVVGPCSVVFGWGIYGGGESVSHGLCLIWSAYLVLAAAIRIVVVAVPAAVRRLVAVVSLAAIRRLVAVVSLAAIRRLAVVAVWRGLLVVEHLGAFLG
jgi:hypothetical protein